MSVSANLTGLLANTTYYYQAVATNTQGTTTGNTLSFTTATALPLVITTPATFVGTSGANINGDVNPNGLASSVYFEWGDRSDLLSNSSTPQPIGSGTNLLGNFWRLEGLSPDSTYFFRIVTLNVISGVTNKNLWFDAKLQDSSSETYRDDSGCH